LIVLIDYAHLPANTQCLSGSMMLDLLSSRANGAADGAPDFRRRALRLRSYAPTVPCER